MEALYPIDTAKLEWRSAGGIGRQYELLARRGVIAELEFSRRPTKEATCRTVAHSWQIKPIGVMGTRFEIRRSGERELYAAVQLNLSRTKGFLILPGGRLKLAFASTNLFGTDWQWLDENGWGLIGFRQKGLSRMSADVHLAEHAPHHPLTPLLFLVGFYLVYLNFERQLRQAEENSSQLESLAQAVAVGTRKRARRQMAHEMLARTGS